MKKLGLLLGLLLLLSLFTGCGSSAAPIDEALVGTWQWTNHVEWEYVLESDGTGTRDGEEIRWTAEDGIVTFTDAAEIESRWEYEIDGNLLILTGATMSFYYIHAETTPTFTNNPPLLGVWANLRNSADLFVFEPDGTGAMGTEASPIAWWITPNNILLVDNANMERTVMVLSYEIEAEVLTLTAHQIEDRWEFQWLGEDLDSIVSPTG